MKNNINIPQVLGFLLIHLITLYLALKTHFSWKLFLLFSLSYTLKFLGFSLCLHRYFSHKSFQTSRFFQFILGLWANLSFMRGPIRFASGHRHHHKYSDTENDLHSPHIQGIFHAYCGWVFSKDYHENNLGDPTDLSKYPELRFLNRFYYLPNFIFYLILYIIGGVDALFWGGLLPTIFVWHMAFFTTVGFHSYGTQRFLTHDKSKNSLLLALLTFGEGWHNNHHYHMNSANFGHGLKEIDFSFSMIWLLEKLGIIWKVNRFKK